MKQWIILNKLIIDLFDNPVGYLLTCGWLASLAVFQAKALQNRVF
jgi:hypothetical protein